MMRVASSKVMPHFCFSTLQPSLSTHLAAPCLVSLPALREVVGVVVATHVYRSAFGVRSRSFHTGGLVFPPTT